MNRILGVLRLDGQPVTDLSLRRCKYTPLWQPDHHADYIDKAIGLSSTQRFITPECAQCLMPYVDVVNQCVIIADVYLTNRTQLCQLLAVNPHLADAELLLLAYLKWGQDCTQHLAGQFMFAIWDQPKAQLFVAVDQFANRPCFYAYQPGQYFIFCNEFSPFRILCPQLQVNENLFAEFALDSFAQSDTAYKQVKKLAPGHQLQVDQQGMQQRCYWRLKDQKRKLPYKTRAQYYAAFAAQFERAVQACLRTPYAISAHISGGLDSSSVASQAAKLLSVKHQTLYGFTAVPKDLEGPSYRPNWYYHELPRVQAVLEQYPNIQHYAYVASPQNDIFAKLQVFYPYIDQPIRNVSNYDWVLASNDYALAQNARILLLGAAGNASISWPGQSWRQTFGLIRKTLQAAIKPKSLYDHFFARVHPKLLNSRAGKRMLRQRGSALNPHYQMLSGERDAPLKSSIYPIQLWHGVAMLDPTQDLELVEFCYNLPEWVYFTGKETLNKRLLVREALAGVMPEAVRLNPYRGEQAADWYVQYNQHQAHWKAQLLGIKPASVDILWRCYDRAKMLALFDAYPVIAGTPNKEINNAVCHGLMRCMSVGFYLNGLLGSPK